MTAALKASVRALVNVSLLEFEVFRDSRTSIKASLEASMDASIYHQEPERTKTTRPLRSLRLSILLTPDRVFTVQHKVTAGTGALSTGRSRLELKNHEFLEALALPQPLGSTDSFTLWKSQSCKPKRSQDLCSMFSASRQVADQQQFHHGLAIFYNLPLRLYTEVLVAFHQKTLVRILGYRDTLRQVGFPC